MTSVLPAWKVELLEKKKKKEQDQRQKLEDEKARNVAIPEWKRSLLERKKEGSSDLPETRNAGQPGSLSVNSVFGTRILRKNSEKTIAIATASQRPVSKSEDELIDTRKVLQHHEFTSNAVDPKVNSCVTNAVDIPTEVEHSGNKRGSLRREVVNGSDNSQSDVASPREDLEVKLSSDESHEVELDNELVTVPSVLTYKRMFEQSKPGNDKEISAPWSALSTESFKTDSKSNKSTSENTLDIVNNNEQAQIPNKSFGNIAQSVFKTKSTSVTEPEMLEHKTSGPSYSIAPKPYKNFVITPPWLKNSLPRNVNFHPGKISFQDPLSTAADRSFEDLQQSDQNRVIESPTQDKVEKISANSDVIISASATEQGKEKAPETDFKEYAPHQSKQSCVQDDQLAVSRVMASRNQKYVLISSKSQQDMTILSERAIADNRQENTIVPVSNESLHCQQRTEDSVSHERFIDSVRSKFGPSIGNQRQTSSEENIFQKTNQSQPIKQEGVLRRAGQSKRTHPSMVRWSADVLSLMSQQNDDSDFDSLTLSVRSASKIPSASDSHAKRPPPPTKRWTADVLSVTSVQADSEAPELSPRSDSSARSSPGNSLNRVRSSSLSDVREEHGVDYFQHKANVSQGIEHRMHKLIRKASISENILNLEQEGSDSLSDEDLLGVNDEDFESEKVPDAMDTLNEITGHKVTDIGPNEKDSKPPFSPRKHSISQNIENKLCELFQRQVSQQSDEGESEGERTTEYDFRTSTDKVVEKVAESTPEELKDDLTPMVTTNKSSTYITQRLGEELNGELDEMEPERNAVKGSVHKLSSLFGSSIWKPNKKNKGSSENKHELKEEPGSKPQKDLSTPKKEDSKKSNLFGKSHKIEGNNKETDSSNVNIFPWLKNLEKDKDRGSKIANNQSKNKSYAQKKSSWRSANQDIDNVQTGWQPAGKTDQETDVVHVLQPVHNTNQDISAIHNAANPLPPVRQTDQDIDTLKTAAHALRPVHKAEKVKQRQLVGKVMIISNASHDDSLPKGVYHKPSIQLPDENKEMASTEARDSKSVMGTRGNEAQIPVVVTEHWNHKQHSLEMEKRMEESVPVTSIDEVPVSAIDIPELCESDVVVSVIDIPASPDVHSAGNFALLNVTSEGSPRSDDDKDDICVSVIDLPSPVAKEDEPSIPQAGYLETEEMLDESDTDEVEGSYDFATGEVTHIMNGHSALESDEESDDDADETDDDDDDDDIPISYIGASPRYQVPQVVFDTEPVALKSCLSPKPARKKMKGRVSFKSSHTIHDYPSEEAFIAVYDELHGNNAMPLKTLQNYQPSALANMEKILERAGGNQPIQEITPAYSNGLDSEHDASVTVDNHPEIKYTDEGQGFTDSSDYASALLF